jgi:hypothetical protein
VESAKSGNPVRFRPEMTFPDPLARCWDPARAPLRGASARTQPHRPSPSLQGQAARTGSPRSARWLLELFGPFIVARGLPHRRPELAPKAETRNSAREAWKFPSGRARSSGEEDHRGVRQFLGKPHDQLVDLTAAYGRAEVVGAITKALEFNAFGAPTTSLTSASASGARARGAE